MIELTNELRKMVESDILRCEAQTSKVGSSKLYSQLIASYSAVDPNFMEGLPQNGKTAVVGDEYDYRPEIDAICCKLKTWLTICPHIEDEESLQTSPQNMVRKFITQGEALKKEEYHSQGGDYIFAYVSGPKFNQWAGEILIFAERYLKGHPLYEKIVHTAKNHNKIISAYDDMMGYLRALAKDNSYFAQSHNGFRDNPIELSNKVFVVHGHDDAAKLDVARTLETVGFHAIILHEQPSEGKTIIEKIETHTDVAFAVVLYTPCDFGRAKEQSVDEEQSRARQNVVFEHGYLTAKLGRNRVCALVKGEVETPGDYNGVVYIPFDQAGAWKLALAKEMRAAGLDFDTNKLL